MTVDWYVYWVVACGIALNLWLLWRAWKLAVAILAAAIIAASITRFTWACAKTHGFKPTRFPRWVYAPAIWFDFFLIELGASGRRSFTHLGGRGVWSGVGDWTVFPKKQEEA